MVKELYPDRESVLLTLPSFAKEPILRILSYLSIKIKMNIIDAKMLVEGEHSEQRLRAISRKGIPVILVSTNNAKRGYEEVLRENNVTFTTITCDNISCAIDKALNFIGLVDGLTMSYVKLAKYIGFMISKKELDVPFNFPFGPEGVKISFLDKPAWPMGLRRPLIRPNSYINKIKTAKVDKQAQIIDINATDLKVARIQGTILGLLATETYGMPRAIVSINTNEGLTHIGIIRGANNSKIIEIKEYNDEYKDYVKKYGLPIKIKISSDRNEVIKFINSFAVTVPPERDDVLSSLLM